MVAQYPNEGLFIALEGGEGGGKSTQSDLLATWLSGLGQRVVTTREPGGTEIGEKLRAIVLDPDTGDMSGRTEALIYAADKAEHVDSVVLPALSSGKVVVCDRYVDSTLAYQGAGRALDPGAVELTARWATHDLRPNLTVVLDVEPATGLARAGRPDRIEAEPPTFHARVRQHFLDLATADPEHYLVLDAAQPVEQIQQLIRENVEPLLERG